jgi:hypothetical protein
MTATKTNFGISTAIPNFTLAGLNSSSTAGRGSAVIDNTSNLFESIMVTIGVKTTGTLANDKCCYIYVYGSEDGTNYNASSAEAVGTDVAVTPDVPTNMSPPVILYCPVGAGATYRTVFDVVKVLGFIPRKWGIVLRNYTGQALDSTESNHQKTYTGIGTTIA